MDSERTLRFVIAPSLLLAWIAVGKLIAGGGDEIESLLKETDSVGKAIIIVSQAPVAQLDRAADFRPGRTPAQV